MTRFPADFAELLTLRGRRLVSGDDPLHGVLTRQPFVTSTGLLGASPGMPALLEQVFGPTLERFEVALPRANSSIQSFIDALPKVGRMHSTPREGPQAEVAWNSAIASGFEAMTQSASYLKFAEALCGRRLEGPVVSQVLRYEAGDYAGPHTDHHPEEERARDGYTDLHLSFCTDGIEQQLLVYEHERHLSRVESISQNATVTAYRLPFWHYTTPLVAAPAARRWVVLGTFLDAR